MVFCVPQVRTQLSSEWCAADLWQKSTVWTLSIKMKSVRFLYGSLPDYGLSQFANVMVTVQDCLDGFTNMEYDGSLLCTSMLGCCCVYLSSCFCFHSILYGQPGQWDGSVPHAPLSRSLLSATFTLPRSEELSKRAKIIDH